MSDKNIEAELSDADLEQAAGGVIGDCTGGGYPIKPGKPVIDEPGYPGGCFPTDDAPTTF